MLSLELISLVLCFQACNKLTTYEHTVRIKEKENQKADGNKAGCCCCSCCGAGSSKSPPSLPTEHHSKPNNHDQLQNSSPYKATEFIYDRSEDPVGKHAAKNGALANVNADRSKSKFDGISPALPANHHHLPPIQTISSSVSLDDRRNSNGKMSSNRLAPLTQNKNSFPQGQNYLDINYKMTYEPANSEPSQENHRVKRSANSGKRGEENSTLEMRQMDEGENPLDDGLTKSRGRFRMDQTPSPKPNSRSLPPLSRSSNNNLQRANGSIHGTDRIDDSNDDEVQEISSNRFMKPKKPQKITEPVQEGYDFEYKPKTTHSYNVSNESLRMNVQNETSSRVRSERRRRRANPLTALPNRASSRFNDRDAEMNQSDTSLGSSQRKYDENIRLSNLNTTLSPKPLNNKPLGYTVSTQSFLKNGSTSSLEEVDPRSKPGERQLPNPYQASSGSGDKQGWTNKKSSYIDVDENERRMNKSYDLGRHGDQSERNAQITTRNAINYSVKTDLIKEIRDDATAAARKNNLRKSSEGVSDDDDDDTVIFNDSRVNNTSMQRR